MATEVWKGQDRKGKHKFVQAIEDQIKLIHIPGHCDRLRGLDERFQLLPVSHYCSNILAKQHEIKGKDGIK